jgi:hypothetical protein
MTIEPRTELQRWNDMNTEFASQMGESCNACKMLRDELRWAQHTATDYVNPDGTLCAVSLAMVINGIYERLDELERAQQ